MTLYPCLYWAYCIFAVLSSLFICRFSEWASAYCSAGLVTSSSSWNWSCYRFMFILLINNPNLIMRRSEPLGKDIPRLAHLFGLLLKLNGLQKLSISQCRNFDCVLWRQIRRSEIFCIDLIEVDSSEVVMGFNFCSA